MSALARADLEHLLRVRKLDTTLTSAKPLVAGGCAVAPTSLAAIDGPLGGGWPRGQVSELVGAVSSGLTWVAAMSLAAATRRGELAALIDTTDTFDPPSAATAGFLWPHLLWVRGTALGPAPPCWPATRPGREPDLWQVAVDRAIKAAALVLDAGGFDVVVLDLLGVPPALVGRLPFTTWRRLQRMIEGRRTACVLLHARPVGRSAGGVTVRLDPAGSVAGRWVGASARACRLEGVQFEVRVTGRLVSGGDRSIGLPVPDAAPRGLAGVARCSASPGFRSDAAGSDAAAADPAGLCGMRDRSAVGRAAD
jgi:hypothetical protein